MTKKNSATQAPAEPEVTRPSTVKPAPNQKKLIDDGSPTPPAGGVLVMDEARALVRRTAKYMRPLPINWQQWIVECLSAEVQTQLQDALDVPEDPPAGGNRESPDDEVV